MRKTGVGMDYLVLRKLLSTTSLLALAATLAACSSEVERFGEPGSGFTSNQNEIFTSSVRTPAGASSYDQPMPAAVSPVASGNGGQQPVYRDPGYQSASVQAPVYKQPSYNQPVYSVPVAEPVSTQVSSVQDDSVSLTTGSINRNSVPSYAAQPMPPLPSESYQSSSAPAYVDVAQRSSVRDYSSRSSANQAALNGPPVVVSRFDSLPQSGPREKNQYAYATQSSSARVPVTVPVSAYSGGQQPVTQQPAVQQPVAQPSRFSLARIFSLPKTAPRSKAVDYTSTASITPPQPIPVSNQSGYGYGNGYSSSSAPVSSQMPTVHNAARTSGQWTSVGGTMVNVEQGEDLQSLSRRYGVPVEALSEINDMNGQTYVAPGRRILIPVFQQHGYQSYASSRRALPQGNAPMQVASLGADAVQLPYVMRVPKGNPMRMRGQSAYGQQIVKLQQNANAENRHMVNPGETLSGIASRYQVSTQALAQANGMSVDSPLRMGQRLHIPSRGQQSSVDYTTTASIGRNVGNDFASRASVDVSAPVVAAVPKVKPRWVQEMAQSSVRSSSGRLPVQKSQDVASLNEAIGLPVENSVQAVSSSAPVAVQSDPVSDEAKFRWPVRGRIIAGFGAGDSGVRNEGINLSVPAGTSVRAAENGTVIYAGDELKMYGNFILVRHTNGWVTAYAHNEKLLVQKGQVVRRGQIIAQAGMSGNVKAPQLHFELRIKGDPVDPVPYLI